MEKAIALDSWRTGIALDSWRNVTALESWRKTIALESWRKTIASDHGSRSWQRIGAANRPPAVPLSRGDPHRRTEPPVQPTPLARAGAGRESGCVSQSAARSVLLRLPAGRLTGDVGLQLQLLQ
jgi:hypothetical protein